MPTMSIEILCVGASNITLPEVNMIGLDKTYPPRSDRAPSLWQSHMDAIGGVLVHLFDPNTKDYNRRWAYEIIEETNWEEFRFKPDVLKEVERVFGYLIGRSQSGELYFYSDAQWSNDPMVSDTPQSLSSFLAALYIRPIRMNTVFHIVKG